jgi:uncharacterized membrane protein
MPPFYKLLQLNSLLCKTMMALSIAVALLQTACIGISVHANWNYQCDQPITIYLIIYAVHLVLSTMVDIYVQLKTDDEDEERFSLK